MSDSYFFICVTMIVAVMLVILLSRRHFEENVEANQRKLASKNWLRLCKIEKRFEKRIRRQTK